MQDHDLAPSPVPSGNVVSTHPLEPDELRRDKVVLHLAGPDRAVFKPSLRSRMLALLLVFLGLLLLAAGPLAGWLPGPRVLLRPQDDYRYQIAAALSGGFLLLGVIGMFRLTRARRYTWDRRLGLAWEGGYRSGLPDSDYTVPLENILALQALEKSVAGGALCELNMVLRDPPDRRINALQLSAGPATRRDLERLAAFLGTPLQLANYEKADWISQDPFVETPDQQPDDPSRMDL